METKASNKERCKVKKKDYELINVIRVHNESTGFAEPVKPAADGESPVMVVLRDDQARRLSQSGHIKHTT